MEKEKSWFENNFDQIIIIVSIVIVGLTFLSYILNESFCLTYELNTDKLGSFGEFIGGFLGTVLTIIATVYIYKTYTNQKEELENQRKLITQQQFESTFFNMLNVHRELKKDFQLNSKIKICDIAIYIEKPDTETLDKGFGNKVKEENVTFYNGVNVFNFIRMDFEVLFRMFKKLRIEVDNNDFNSYIIIYKIKEDLKNNRTLLEKNEIEIIDKIFWHIFDNYRNILSHYFRNIYHILKFIRENEIQNNVDYQKYADIFQSQLNEDEQFLLFYNFIVFDDKKKKEFSTVSLANQYQFLENLGWNNLLDKELHNNKNFYTFEIK